MSLPYVIEANAAPRASHLASLRDEIRRSLSTGADLSFARVFAILATGAGTGAFAAKLEARGSLSIKSATELVNEGSHFVAPIEGISTEIQRADVSVARKVAIRIASGGAVDSQEPLVLDFGDRGQVVFTIRELPPQLQWGTDFCLAEIRFGADRVSCKLIELGDPDHVIEFRGLFDETGALAAVPRSRGAAVSMLVRAAFLDLGCPGGGDPPPEHSGRCIRLHFKYLFQPIVPAASMLSAIQEVYGPSGLVVQKVSDENLNLPLLADLDVGECRSGSTTREQDDLFGHRSGARATDIVVYFVRSTIPSFAGCAAHPRGRPAVVIASVASRWCLGHEIGHVLGLTHVQPDDPRRLMYRIDSYTDLPPDIVQGEVARMKRSDYATDDC